MAVNREWFTVEEAAEYLRVSRRTIYKLIQEGKLPALQIGKERGRRFRIEDLDKVLRREEKPSDNTALLNLSAEADPVLAELWDNDKDSAYDRISQSYFWTKKWQEEERKADEDIKNVRVKVFDTTEELFKELGQ